MVNPDPALGISADFDGDQFRNAIRFAMQMGTPPEVGKRASFVFKSTGRTYWKDAGVDDAGDPRTIQQMSPRLDRDGKPLDPTIQVINTAPVIKTVDCVVEITRADADELPVGNFRPTKATVTLLDEQYDQVKGCRELLFNGDRYLYGYEPEGLGLFDVGVNTIIFYATDET
jgi:hypothetical protein